MASREEADPKLDAALAALSGIGESGGQASDDDARWAKRVASRVSTLTAPSRRELDPLFEAPFPDGFVDPPHRDFDTDNFDREQGAADDHTNAASAVEFGEARGWEGSMSDSDERPPNSLAALSGLTRSGPASNPDAMEGAAKGDDSGLINLKAMTDPPPAPPAEEVAAAAPTLDAHKTVAAVPSAISGAKIPIASTASANAPPASSTQPSAVSAPAAARAAEPRAKKGGAVIWLGLGGVAAAAAAAFFFVGPMARKSEETASAQPSAPAAAEQKAVQKKAEGEKVAGNDIPAPAASGVPEVDPGAPHAGGPVGKPAGTTAPNYNSKSGSPGPTPTAPGPAASAKPTSDPKANPGGGSLDDVLGIGKDQPTTKKPEGDNLPDKPESMEVRSAINSKLSGGNSCVKGLEGPSNVSVTFGPAGTVSGVVVTSGPAKGTGAELCIKNAFSSAKVPASKKGATGSATLVP